MPLKSEFGKSPLNRFHWLAIGTFLTVASIVGVNGLILSRLHQNTLQEVQSSLLRHSLALSEVADRTFKSTDLILTEAVEKLRSATMADNNVYQISDYQIHTYLNEQMAGLPYINALVVFDAAGIRVNSSRNWPVQNDDLSHREYIKALRANPKLPFFIGRPMVGAASGSFEIVFAKPILNRSGEFVGVLMAPILLKYFEDIFQSTSFGDGYAATLMRDDGTVLARYPATNMIGKIAQPSVLKLLDNSNSGTSSAISPIDHQKRIASGYRLKNFPLAVIATQNEYAAFAQWRDTAIMMGIAAALMSVIIIFSAILIARSWKTHERFEAAQREAIHSKNMNLLAQAELGRQRDLAQQNMRFNAAVENMSQGICMFDNQQKMIVCNKLYADMYGLNDEQTKPGTTLTKILEYRIAQGNAPEDPQKYIDERIAEVTANRRYQAVNKLKDGRYIRVAHCPTRDGGWVATHDDITEQRRAEQELDETKKFLNSIIENIPVAVVVKDAETRKLVLVNNAFEKLIALPRADLLGNDVFDLFKKEHAELIDAADREYLAGQSDEGTKEYDVDTPMHGLRTLTTNRIAIRDSEGKAKYLVGVIDDVTERRRTEQRISFMAHHDALTGLHNRLTVVQKIEEAAARQRRYSEPFSVLILDLDRFKQVNDTLGHPAGDTLLREVAARLKPLLREVDTFARLGGDEFAILQSNETNQREAARALADRVIEIVAEPFEIDGNEITVATSVGIALAPEHATNSDELLKMADLALYRAKAAGRNGYCFFHPEMGEAMVARHELENDLRRAIQQDEFKLLYQPIIDVKTLKICGAEALNSVAASDQRPRCTRSIYSSGRGYRFDRPDRGVGSVYCLHSGSVLAQRRQDCGQFVRCPVPQVQFVRCRYVCTRRIRTGTRTTRT